MSKRITALLLAGGKSSRMGMDKGLIEIDNGITLVEKIVHVLEDLFDKIIIVANDQASYKKFGLTIVEDLIKDKGPLGGIFSGLCFSKSELNFVVGCDMPFINPSLIEYMCAKPDEYDVVIPERNGRFESLFARYSKRALPVLFSHLMKDSLMIQDVLKDLRVLKILPQEVERFDPDHLSFVNINTPEDLKELGRT